MGLVDTDNVKNSHASIERQQDAERASALLKIINEYRVYTQRFETLPTWDILEFLQKLDNEVNERYNKEVKDAERDKIKEQYFLLTHKKPFL
jgi:biotin-(acetyl-CoA carboxylase) ligase